MSPPKRTDVCFDKGISLFLATSSEDESPIMYQRLKDIDNKGLSEDT
jgi:hypothetical protein